MTNNFYYSPAGLSWISVELNQRPLKACLGRNKLSAISGKSGNLSNMSNPLVYSQQNKLELLMRRKYDFIHLVFC